jgi:nitrogen fixation/metabolism regulation signal transduction histidine kinase
VKYVNTINRDLSSFFSSIKNEDSSLIFSGNKNNSLNKNLHQCLNDINKTIGKIRTDNAKQNLYLQNVVEHVGVGLISFDENGKLELCNDAAIEMLKISSIHHINVLESVHPELPEIMLSLKPNQTKLLKIVVDNEILQVSLKANIFKTGNKTFRLVSLQNIINELERNELISYQKLIRVLTHEIMNSISPITSLTTTITRYFRNENSMKTLTAGEIDNTIIDRTLNGLNTIEETGKGLLDFVNNYRSLTSLPIPKMKKFAISGLLQTVRLLMREEDIAENIEIKISTSPQNLELSADEKQLEMVLINLTKNSLQALDRKKDGKIHLRAYKSESEQTIIDIIDNGKGIPNDVFENIFVPFYTTREGGSGIGLSLSRQIMRLHAGSISVYSKPDVKTVFSLKF